MLRGDILFRPPTNAQGLVKLTYSLVDKRDKVIRTILIHVTPGVPARPKHGRPAAAG